MYYWCQFLRLNVSAHIYKQLLSTQREMQRTGARASPGMLSKCLAPYGTSVAKVTIGEARARAPVLLGIYAPIR
jgi:hypothetical protein